MPLLWGPTLTPLYSYMVYLCRKRVSRRVRPSCRPCTIGLLLPLGGECIDHVSAHQVSISPRSTERVMLIPQ